MARGSPVRKDRSPRLSAISLHSVIASAPAQYVFSTNVPTLVREGEPANRSVIVLQVCQVQRFLNLVLVPGIF